LSLELDARVARIKADLRLTPEQEQTWSGFESAVHDIGKKLDQDQGWHLESGAKNTA
jgi:hypothetical protein